MTTIVKALLVLGFAAGSIVTHLSGLPVYTAALLVCSARVALSLLEGFEKDERAGVTNENSKLQGQGAGVTETLCQKNKGSVRSARRRRSVKADGKPGTRPDAFSFSSDSPTFVDRVQEYKNVPKPRSPRASKVQRKAVRDTLRDVEAARKEYELYNRLSKSRRLPNPYEIRERKK